MGLIHTKGTLMWYLVQQQPGETIGISCNSDYNKLALLMSVKQRYDSKNFYEILSSEEVGLLDNNS